MAVKPWSVGILRVGLSMPECSCPVLLTLIAVMHARPCARGSFPLALTDLPGISHGIEARPRHGGIRAIEELRNASPRHVRAIWGSVGRRISVRDGPNVRVHAENFLQDIENTVPSAAVKVPVDGFMQIAPVVN
jgi:hypothetical protein